jgi:opacity protein-like surface antigen
MKHNECRMSDGEWRMSEHPPLAIGHSPFPNPAIVAGLFLTVATAGWAGPPEPFSLGPEPTLGQPIEAVSFASDRRWTLDLVGVGVLDASNRRVKMAGARVGVGYYVLDNLACRLELTGYHVSEEPGDAAAGQASFGLRHHLFDLGKSSLFVDVGGGVFEAGRRVPEGGTQFNFTFETGLGVAIPLSDRIDLEVGARYFHLSNASLHGSDRNPSVNGPEAFLGLMFRF